MKNTGMNQQDQQEVADGLTAVRLCPANNEGDGGHL